MIVIAKTMREADPSLTKSSTKEYYWPNATKYLKKCLQCHRFTPSNRPSTDVHTLRSPWTFMQLGLDVVGLLPQVLTQFRFLLVAMDYFIKWVEVMPLSDFIGHQIVKFL